MRADAARRQQLTTSDTPQQAFANLDRIAQQVQGLATDEQPPDVAVDCSVIVDASLWHRSQAWRLRRDIQRLVSPCIVVKVDRVGPHPPRMV